MKTATLKVGIQKSGKLTNDSIKLFKNAGIKFNSLGKLKINAINFPLKIFFLRSCDIPLFVESGILDIGIVGKNLVVEKGVRVKIVSELDFGKCRVSIAVLKNFKYESILDLNNTVIATSYTKTLSRFLTENKISATIHEIAGSVEIAPSIGLANVVCDIVNSGKTLSENNLKEVKILFESEAVMTANEQLSIEKKDLLEKLLLKIKSSTKCKKSSNGEHQYIYPRMEESIDRDRYKNLTDPYCKHCLKIQTIITSKIGDQKNAK